MAAEMEGKMLSSPSSDWILHKSGTNSAEKAAMKKDEEGSPTSTLDAHLVLVELSPKREKTAVGDGEMVAPEAGAAEEGKAKPAGAKKKTTRMVRVKQEYIDWILEHPRKPYRPMAQELIDRIPTPELRERVRANMASAAALHKEVRDKDVDILEQYRLKGYAMEEIPIRDGDDEEDEVVVLN